MFDFRPRLLVEMTAESRNQQVEINMQLKYVLVVPNDVEEGDVTLFQGWNPVVRNHRFLTLLSLLSTLPAAPKEIFMDQRELIEFRTSGVLRNISSIGTNLLSQVKFGRPDEIIVFLALAQDVDLIKQTQFGAHKKNIVLSFSDGLDVVNIEKRKRDGYRFIDEEILFLLQSSDDECSTLRVAYNTEVRFPKSHGINAPSVAVLKALGYQVDQPDGSPNNNFEEAEQLVIDSAKIVLDCLGGAEDAREILLYSPSVKVNFYNFKDNSWNQLLRNVKEKWKRSLLELCFRNPGYSEFHIAFDSQPSNPYSDPIVGPILYERQCETYATTASVAIMAASEGLISLRLPNAVNLHGSQLRNIETLAKRSDQKAETLLQKAYVKYSYDLEKAIGSSSIDFIRTNSLACKLCSDVPLEWVYLGRLPLMISHEVSKIPMTPGNSQLQFASMGERIGIRESDSKKVLVVRSFSNEDPLQKVMEECLQSFDLANRLTITFTDVQTRAEACAALNSFDGAIVIFDCHGGHSGNSSSGWLKFGKEKINTWELAYDARIPPIVLLSACSTSAIGGSHVSVAAGLLRSGAHSVLGTFLPVNGARSALFMARILARLDTYLPMVKKFGYKIVTWRTFVHSVMKMSYLTDVLGYFRFELNLINKDTFTQIEIEALTTIGVGDPEWYNRALESVSAACGVSVPDLVKKIQEEHPLMETMRYCHVGLPEHVGIILEDEPTLIMNEPTLSEG